MDADEGGDAGAREDKRTAILKAAQQLISSNRFGNTSVDAIAKCGGVSKATVYAYFGSKEALFKKALDDMVCAMPDLQKSISGFQGSLRARLTSVAHAILEISAGPAMQGLQRMLADSERFFLGRPDTCWDLCFERYDKAMQEFFSTEVTKGVLTIPDVASASSQFFGLIAGGSIARALLTDAASTSDSRLSTYLDCTVELFIRGYQPRPDSRGRFDKEGSAG